MAGAVSAGAYTAGVIDFLIEALDAWEGREALTGLLENQLPEHDVPSVCPGAARRRDYPAILAENIDRKWVPSAKHADDAARNLSPGWARKSTFAGSGTKDRDGNDLRRPAHHRLEDIARAALSFDRGQPCARAYVANQLRAFHVTNLKACLSGTT